MLDIYEKNVVNHTLHWFACVGAENTDTPILDNKILDEEGILVQFEFGSSID